MIDLFVPMKDKVSSVFRESHESSNHTYTQAHIEKSLSTTVSSVSVGVMSCPKKGNLVNSNRRDKEYSIWNSEKSAFVHRLCQQLHLPRMWKKRRTYVWCWCLENSRRWARSRHIRM